MAESNMREELQRQAGLSRQSHEQAQREAHRAVRKATRRAHWLAGIAIALWLLTASGIVAVLFGYLVFFMPWMSAWVEMVAETTTSASAPADWGIGILRNSGEAFQAMGLYMSYGGMIVAGLMALAAGSTVAFVYASRQATLKQIQLSLAEIVEQLKRQSTQ